MGWTGVWFLVFTIVVFFVIRIGTDVANLSEGVVPAEGEFDRRYAENPILAYLHIIPGLVYLLGAPFQLSARIRRANYRRHRWVGRVVLVAGFLTGVMAIAVGVVMPFGAFAEMSATIVFGLYFLTALVFAYRAIRAGRPVQHRRFMIRAYAIGIGVGLIRVVVGVGAAFGVEIEQSFGAAFWIAFVVMAVLGEVWLRIRPDRVA